MVRINYACNDWNSEKRNKYLMKLILKIGHSLSGVQVVSKLVEFAVVLNLNSVNNIIKMI